MNHESIKSPSGGGDKWGTPADLWSEIRSKYFHPFDIYTISDPCPNKSRILDVTFCCAGDGLKWFWSNPFFLNPPWSDIGPWIKKAHESKRYGVALLPARTDQKWFHEYAPLCRVVHIRGRVNYINPKTGTSQVIDKKTGKLKNGAIATPSMLMIFGTGSGVEYWEPECNKKGMR